MGAGPWLWIRGAAASHVETLGDDPPRAEAALVLGTEVLRAGTPSVRLAERVEVAVQLYESGAVPLLIMSGTDESDTGQSEVAVMREYAISLGVPADAIALDPLGLDTHASCVRAATVFELESVVVVTNEFHTYRAVWLCEQAGLEASAVHAPITWNAWTARGNAREVAAAWKAFLDVAGVPLS